ncbi:Cytochrome_P460 domain-containing protein [Nitrospira tepida]|uniref:Cytochrome_P460 domain-containing protein n=1 Tax=Nitrospira tepida TaxID=2973512 RepID=A0AA86T2D8_9BACT|nr:cytochrome P460 family protein [Nitrospira tepida]CAI4030515.1 Cytochrome_P460 domain-containing protein [Nitrospira tepida]
MKATITVAAACVGFGLLGVGWHLIVHADSAPKDGELALPGEYRSWPKFLTEVQREDAKQVRELYVNPVGARACPVSAFPNGTMMVMELYKAKADGGALAKGSDGKLVKGELARIFVMGKNEGWGQGHPDHLKNGAWVYAAYGPGGKALAEDFTKCRACHAPLAQKDFVHRYDEFCAQRAYSSH